MNYLRIKELLDKDERSIAWLSRRTGIGENALGRIVSGKTKKIEFNTIKKLLRALDCKTEDLFNFKK